MSTATRAERDVLETLAAGGGSAEVEEFEFACDGGRVELPTLVADAFEISAANARRLVGEGKVTLDGRAVGERELRFRLPADEVDGAVIGLGERVRRLRRLARWLDGPGLCRWLKQEGLVTKPDSELKESMARAFRRWQEGTHADVYTVDALLLCCGSRLWEIPDELWVKRRPPRAPARKVSERERRRAARRYLKGVPAVEIGRELGVSGKAVRSWAAREKAAA